MCFSCSRILVALFCTFSKASMSYFEVNHISFVLQSLFRLSDSNSDEYIHSPPRGVSREWGVALYGAYVADVNLDSSALKDAVVDCSTTWDGSEFQSPTVRSSNRKRVAECLC